MIGDDDERLGMLPQPFVQPHGPLGGPHEECFDVFDANGRVIGQKPRSQVHADGLWHRAVHVLVFEPDGNLLLQKRALNKDVCPGLWDLSCAEHLQIGESFASAAQRGLWEELHIKAPMQALTCVRKVHTQTFIDACCALQDREQVETWAVIYRGRCRADPAEVADLRFMGWPGLCHEVQANPQHFTPWLRQELAWHGTQVPWPTASVLDAIDAQPG